MERVWRGESPLRLELFGGKKHRRPYYTFIGTDSVELLKVRKERWKAWIRREPLPEELVFLSKRRKPLTPIWVNRVFKETVVRLANQGLVSRSNPASWHSHSLRHSFKTQGKCARMPSDFVELWMGHDGGIRRVYDDRDQVHAEDLRTLRNLLSDSERPSRHLGNSPVVGCHKDGLAGSKVVSSQDAQYHFRD